MPAFSAEPGPQDAITAMPGAYAIAARQPGTCAIIGPRGDRVTFGDLGRTVNQLTNALVSLGLKPGDTVASVQHNGISHFEVILAGTQAGLVVVPVNTHLTPVEAAYIISDCGAKAVIASHDLAAALAPVRDILPEHLFAAGGPGGERGAEPPLAVSEGVPGWADYAALRESGSPEPPAERIAGTVMGYTSGSPAAPRGCGASPPRRTGTSDQRDPTVPATVRVPALRGGAPGLRAALPRGPADLLAEPAAHGAHAGGAREVRRDGRPGGD